MIDRLRAKSWDESLGQPPDSIHLPQHLIDVVKCSVAILAATRDNQLRAFGLDPAVVGDRCAKIVVVAAACHDLGKANSHFQPLVHASARPDAQRIKQAVRHEWISWFLLQQSEMQSWIKSHLLGSYAELDWHILLWAITGHHPAFGREIPTEQSNGSNDKIEIYRSHPDYRECLDLVAKTLDEPNCPFQLESQVYSVETDILASIRDSLSTSMLLRQTWRRDPATTAPCLGLSSRSYRNWMVSQFS